MGKTREYLDPFCGCYGRVGLELGRSPKVASELWVHPVAFVGVRMGSCCEETWFPLIRFRER